MKEQLLPSHKQIYALAYLVSAIGSAFTTNLAANGVPTAITGAIENDTTGNADSASTVATAENTGTTSYPRLANLRWKSGIKKQTQG